MDFECFIEPRMCTGKGAGKARRRDKKRAEEDEEVVLAGEGSGGEDRELSVREWLDEHGLG